MQDNSVGNYSNDHRRPQVLLMHEEIEWNKNRTALDFKTFWLPLPIADRTGIPEEFRKVINVKRIISDNLQPFYMVLESLGFYKKPTLCIYESTGYSKEENEQ